MNAEGDGDGGGGKQEDQQPMLDQTKSKSEAKTKTKAKVKAKVKVRAKSRDTFHRMNFLFQAAHCAASIPSIGPDVSKHYVKTLRGVSRRLVLRLAPGVKHRVCMKCDVLLIPGDTESVRLHASEGQQWRSSRCLKCGNVERIIMRDEQPVLNERRAEVRQGSSSSLVDGKVVSKRRKADRNMKKKRRRQEEKGKKKQRQNAEPGV